MCTNRILCIAAGLALTIGVSSNVCAAAAAASPNIPLPPGAQLLQQSHRLLSQSNGFSPTTFVKHVLDFTITASALYQGALLSGGDFTTIDTATDVKCSNSAGCTIGFDTMVTLESNSVNGNPWGIAVLVDGDYDPWAPFIGEAFTRVDTEGTSPHSVTVAKGTHTLQVQVYVTDDATLGFWHVDYRIYKP